MRTQLSSWRRAIHTSAYVLVQCERQKGTADGASEAGTPCILTGRHTALGPQRLLTALLSQLVTAVTVLEKVSSATEDLPFLSAVGRTDLRRQL